MMSLTYRLLIHSLNEIVQVVKDDKEYLAGNEAKNISVLQAKDSEGLSILVCEDGTIASVGFDSEIRKVCKKEDVHYVVDGTGKCALPGFIDAHTHAVWAGDRVHEFAMKLAGANYLDIHKTGGGIHFTVDHVRRASEEELFQDLKQKLKHMLEAGTTTVECKSGYGLDLETEVKMLKVIEQAKSDPDIHVDISSTFCGAHAVPKGQTAEEATQNIINQHIPQITALNSAGELSVENIDVFCEKGVFTVEQTERILRAGLQAGFQANFHGEQLNYLGSVEMGAKLGVRAISHLEEVSSQGIQAMADAGTVAVILPTTAYILRLKSPPVRELLEAGVPVALGSDFCPNAPCFVMPITMHLACVQLKMSLDEAMAAATINSAASIGRAKTLGSLQPRKVADIVLVHAPKWQHIIYQFGNHLNLISHVIKAGRVVFSK